MSSAKEIRTKIKSVRSTKKITGAMEMVAASKMRKTNERMTRSKPYAKKIYEVIGHVANANSEYHHDFMTVRPVKRVGFIIVSTDRGLCGGLNTNLFRQVTKALKHYSEKEIEVDVCAIGNKAISFFNRFGGKVVATANHLGDMPQLNDLIGVVKVMLNAYSNNDIDELHIFSNEFINTMSQKPLQQQLLPLLPSDDQQLTGHWDYIYEPDAKELLDLLLTRYIESQVYQAVIENIACEQAAKMVAMKSASDNAGKIIDELQLAYNKARQAMITQEISEIVAGAEAV